jgi:hypothetical protein
MLRDFTAMLAAFALMLFSVAPPAAAQSGWPVAGPQEQASAGQYPSVSQDSAQPPSDSGPDLNAEPQSNPQQDAAADQKHGIARLSIVQGDVNIKRGDNGELTAAVANAPLATQDRLQTGSGSRAEVELDYANIVRLAPNTDLGFADLEYRRYQMQLGAGTIIFRVLRNSASQVELDTPSIGFRPTSEGEFRVSILPDGTTLITARAGNAEIFGPRGSEPIAAGKTVLVRGNPNDPEFQDSYEPPRDQFDDWSARRDNDLLHSRSYQYVSPDIPGADDLDAYGQWVPSQQYGQVWAPQSEPQGWSPYSTGQWAWQDYYGWTWVDSAPWGWAPYHYGRWFYNGGYGWCWWPGAIRSSYFWSPALVGFFGWGGFGVGLGLGGLGWVALAPYEAYHRWWGPGWYGRGWGGYGFRGYGNFARNVDIARTYRNAAYRNGAITATYARFGGPQQRFNVATRSQLTNVSAFRGGRIPITPTRGSYQFSNRTAVANPRLASAAGQRFFQSSQIRSQTFGSPAHGAAPNMSNGYAERNAAPSVSRSSSGWQRFGDPGNSSGAMRQGFAGRTDTGGWHSFGQPQGRAGSYSSPRNTTPAPYRYSAPTATPRSYSPSSSAPRYSGPSSYAPRTGQSYSAPAYTGPRYNAPSYTAPRYSPPSYSAPHSSAPSQHVNAPHYNAPSGGSSHSGGSSPHAGGGGGGSHGGGGEHHR